MMYANKTHNKANYRFEIKDQLNMILFVLSDNVIEKKSATVYRHYKVILLLIIHH